MFSLADQVGDNPVVLPNLQIFLLQPHEFGAAEPPLHTTFMDDKGVSRY
jgi:hypothetical protein